MKKVKPCVLIILDGWGLNPEKDGNAIYQANTPYLDNLFKEYPHSELLCSGKSVGLPPGIMGNSEVGHLNIGAGRVVYQDLLRINKSIKDGSFYKNKELNSIISIVKDKNGSLHLMGLVSDGGVHSQLEHLYALIDLAEKKNLKKIYIHPIMDGRDTPPDSGIKYLKSLTDYINKKNIGTIASICGRFYAMDRDTRWERVEKAFRLYTNGEGIEYVDPIKAIQDAYNKNETDEFIKPIVIMKDKKPVGKIIDNDGIIFFNFRADRAREITRAFIDQQFNFFKREKIPKLCDYVCMTFYDENFSLPVVFPPVRFEKILGEVISENNLTQFRIAETEKYAHVTYFFNGGEEKPFKGEERCLVPSSREIATYDLKPEMSAFKVRDAVIERISSKQDDLIVLNFANIDMVGHTGIINAAVKACEAVDQCVHDVVEVLKTKRRTILLTADHGNGEQLLQKNGSPHTAHTLNPVPLILINHNQKKARLKKGSLADIAPTILDIMKIKKPDQMTGSSLLA